MRASSLRWIRENSRPKTYPREPTISRGKVVKLKKLLPRIEIYSQPRHNYGADNFRPYAVSPMALTYRASRRINNLALPVPRKQFFDPRFDPEQNWYIIMMITEKTMNHKASERLKRLARPLRPIKKWEPPEEKSLVKPSALQYKATPIIEKLAQPRMKSKKFKKSKPVYVKKGALTATATERTTRLAKPIPREAPPTNIPGVNPKALTACCTRRIERLATPRAPCTKIKKHPINPKSRNNKKKRKGSDYSDNDDYSV